MSELATKSEQARFVFTGQLRADSFIEFACHRAARLGLRIDVGQISDQAVTVQAVTVQAVTVQALTVTVSGAAELVDAFEMACSLGPYDCLVLEVTRHDRKCAA